MWGGGRVICPHMRGFAREIPKNLIIVAPTLAGLILDEPAATLDPMGGTRCSVFECVAPGFGLTGNDGKWIMRRNSNDWDKSSFLE